MDRTHALDEPQKSRCPVLDGPFAPESERYDCKVTCKYCAMNQVTAYHAGSWECDQHPQAPRMRFRRGELDRLGNPIQGANPFSKLEQRPLPKN